MKALPLLLAAVSLSTPAWSLPTGGTVVSGTAAIQTAGNAMTITQGSARAIINWDNFSVGSGHTVLFNQPGSSSAVLNRVVGADPSQIYGQITANGKFFLVNPNGIIVGPSGRIDAAGIILSTTSIADADFNAATIFFGAPPPGSAISVAGTLKATYVLEIRAASVDGGGSGILDAPSVNINGPSNGHPEALQLDIPLSQVPSKVYDASPSAANLGNLVVGDSLNIGGTGGSVALTGGSVAANAGGTFSGASVQSSSGSLTVASASNYTVAITLSTAPGASIQLGAGSLTVASNATNVGTLAVVPGAGVQSSSAGSATVASTPVINNGNAGTLSVATGGSVQLSAGSLTVASNANNAGTLAVVPGGSLLLTTTGRLPVAVPTGVLPSPVRVFNQAPIISSAAGAGSLALPSAPSPVSGITPIAPTRSSPAPGVRTAIAPPIVPSAAGLVEGAVTVRLRLTDASAITLN